MEKFERRGQRLLWAAQANWFNNLLVPLLGYTEFLQGQFGEESEYYEDLAEMRRAALQVQAGVSQMFRMFRPLRRRRSTRRYFLQGVRHNRVRHKRHKAGVTISIPPEGDIMLQRPEGHLNRRSKLRIKKLKEKET